MAVITAIAIGMTALTSLVLVIINTFGGLDRLKQETYTRDKFCLLDCSFTFFFYSLSARAPFGMIHRNDYNMSAKN